MVSMGNVRRSRFALAALGAITACTPSALAAGTFYGVGDLPGGPVSSRITDLSGDGRFVIGHSATEAGQGTSVGSLFRWSAAGGMEDQGFGVLGLTVGGIRGPSISHDGTRASGMFDLFGGFRHVFGGETRPLPDSLLVGDMNSSGTVMVGSPRVNADYFTRWRATNGFAVERITLRPGSQFTYATGVSEDGTSASIYVEENGGGATYLWREGQQPLLVYSVSSGNPTVAENFELSADGEMIIGRTWRWTLDAGITDLTSVITPHSIAPDSRTILGQRSNRATILTADNQILDVADHLAQQHGFNLSGWQLRDIVAMSDDGTVWAGNGINPQGFREGWVAVIPEPSSLSLLALAMAISTRRRR